MSASGDRREKGDLVAGVDLGLVYSPLQTAVMTTKLPTSMYRDVIIMNNRRWVADELVEREVIESAYESTACKRGACVERRKPRSTSTSIEARKRMLFWDQKTMCFSGLI